MKTHANLTGALWAAAEADAQFSRVLKKLHELQRQLPDEFHAPLVDILDEFHAAHSQLQAAKYNVMICFRAANAPQEQQKPRPGA